MINIYRINKIYISIIIVFSIFFNNNIFAQVATSLGPVRDKTELNIGFNRRSNTGNWWSNQTFKNLVSVMNPDVVRYPGGTQANYWDWRVGKFIDNTNKTWGSKEVLKIPEFVDFIPSRTKVIYVVNMARPTPATGVDVNSSEQILKSDATLDNMIIDMKAAITKFVSEGVTPYAIELGNEYYFGNEEGGIYHIIEGSNNSYYAGRDAITGTGIEHSGGSKTQNKKDATVTNAKFYLQNCEKIVSEISQVHPNMKFALVSTKRGTGNSSREYWNNTIYDELEKSDIYPNLYTKITALTQHHYVDDNYGNQTVVTDIATAKVAISEGVSYPVDRTLDYEQAPSKFKIWFTEYGATKKNAETMWTTGMRSAALSLSWIDRGDKVGQLDYHYITDKNVVWPDEPSANVTMNLAPIGIASSMLALASADMTKMQKINFSSNIEVVSGVKALQGYKFYNNDKETLIILNLTDELITGIDLDALFTYSGTRNRTTYWSNTPYNSGVFEGSGIDKLEEVTTNKFTAKKFSITVIEVIDEGLGIKGDHKVSLNVFPNPFNNRVEISNYTGNQVNIYSVEGRDLTKLITIERNNTNTVINTSLLPKGIYILRTETGNSIIDKQ